MTEQVTEHKPALVAQAWHDITCPEGPDCRDRLLHSAAQTIANSGHLDLFLARLEVLEDADEIASCPCGGTRWVNDENWSPEFRGDRRQPGGPGRLPCGFCNHGGWHLPDPFQAAS